MFGLYIMFAERKDAHRLRARIDAACYALATALGLEIGDEFQVWDESHLFWESRDDRKTGLARVTAVLSPRDSLGILSSAQMTADLARGDEDSWRRLLETVCRLLALSPEDILDDQTDSGQWWLPMPRALPSPVILKALKAGDQATWARLMIAVWGTRWRDLFLSHSPYADRKLLLFVCHPRGFDSKEWQVQGYTAAAEYLIAFAKKHGHVFESVVHRGIAVSDLTKVILCSLPPEP